MSVWTWVACGIGIGLAIANAAVTRRLWASPLFERPQKIAQTLFVWLVPMSFLVVRHVLAEPGIGRAIGAADPTQSGAREWDFGSSAIGGHQHHSWDSSSGGGESGFGGGGGGDDGNGA